VAIDVGGGQIPTLRYVVRLKTAALDHPTDPCPRIDSKAIMPYISSMSTLKVTAKGQVTLRKDVLEHLGVGPGEQIDVTKLPDGRIEVRAAPTGEISALFGLLRRKGGPSLSIDEMNEITQQGWSGKVGKKK